MTIVDHLWWQDKANDQVICRVCSFSYTVEEASSLLGVPNCPGPDFVLSRRRYEPRHANRKGWDEFLADLRDLMKSNGFGVLEVGTPMKDFLSETYQLAKERL